MEYGSLVSKSTDLLQPLFSLVRSIPYGILIVTALVFSADLFLLPPQLLKETFLYSAFQHLKKRGVFFIAAS
jgi:hypothetical protein